MPFYTIITTVTDIVVNMLGSENRKLIFLEHLPLAMNVYILYIVPFTS